MAPRLILVLLAAAALAGCFGASARTPTGVVESFYAKRIDLEIAGAPTPHELEAVAPYLTPELHRLLEEAGALRERDAAATPDEKPPFADGDLFSSLFEGPTAFRVVDDQERGDTHRIAVRFTSRQKSDSVSWQDTVVVVPDDGEFAIADVEYGGRWKFAAQGTLRSNLERALAQPGPSKCQLPVPSTWIVTGHAALGFSAMSDAEADDWNGSRLAIARDRMTFRDDACESPSFTTGDMAPDKFEEEFRDSPDALQLPRGPICVTRIACADGAPRPGNLLVHGRGELLLLWDGVWFRATPQRAK
jgi:hypothetical protein